MQRLEVSGAVRPLKWPLGVKWLKSFPMHHSPISQSPTVPEIVNTDSSVKRTHRSTSATHFMVFMVFMAASVLRLELLVVVKS
jgi:hypothetical protein